MIKNGGLLEHASVYGNYYGTPRQYVLDKLAEGLDVILEIDPQGGPPGEEKLSRRSVRVHCAAFPG